MDRPRTDTIEPGQVVLRPSPFEKAIGWLLPLGIAVISAAVIWGALSSDVKSAHSHLATHDARLDICQSDRMEIKTDVAAGNARQGMMIKTMERIEQKLDRALRRRR